MRRSKIKFIILLLIIPFAIVLSACNETTAVGIDLMLNNEVIFDTIEKEYGDTTGLYGFSVKLNYNDGNSLDITNQCIINVTTPNGDDIDYNTYLTKVYSSSLESGYWTLTFTYKEYEKELLINVLEPANTNIYSIDFNCNYNTDFSQNELPYGTKLSGVSISFYENYELINVANIQNQGLYVLKDSLAYTDNLKPTESIVERLYEIEYYEPGDYYITANIKKTGFRACFSEFVKVTITKAKIFVDTTNLELEWAFTMNELYSDVTLEQIQESQNGLSIYGGNLILCSDYDDTNNDNYFNYDKTTLETFSPFFTQYGKFETVNPNLKLNASSEIQTIKMKFVPIGENNTYFFSESDEFDAKISIKKCKVTIPDIESECCNGEHSFTPNKNHSLKILATHSNIYTISANTENILIDNDYRTYYADSNPNIILSIALKYPSNYEWNTNISQGNGYNIYIDTTDNTINVSLFVEKGNLNDYPISIVPIVTGAKLDENNSIDLKLTDLLLNQEFLDGEYTWTILPSGYEINNSISLATGELNDIPNAKNNSLVKTLTITDILSHAKDNKNITIAIKITAPESENWLSYEKVFLVTIMQHTTV